MCQEHLLITLQILNHPDRDILLPLSDRLDVLLRGLMATNPDCFVSPKLWSAHKDVIRSNLASDDERFRPILAAIQRRNIRLAGASAEKEPSCRRRLIKLLDTTLRLPFMNDLPKQCWNIDDDKAKLIQTILEWATSSHRPGTAKVYVAARILRFCARSGADITDAILNFLDSPTCGSGCSKPAFYHLVSELARSDHFSTPKYLQWLIARGGFYDAADVAQDGPCATRLLAELPTHNLSDSIAELRTTLLSRADFMVDEEDEQTKDSMVLMSRALPGMQAAVDLELESSDLPIHENLSDVISKASRTTKSEIGLWLRQKVALQMVQPTIPPLDDWDDSPVKGGTSAISTTDFSTIRGYLEHIDDYSMLADVLKIVTSSNDAEVLASCADTLDLHLDTFAAVGALNGLFDLLVARLRTLAEEMDAVPRIFLVSLSDLASRLPEQKIIAQQLAQEVARSDRKTAADACSPVSDHMALMQTAESDFTDEIEKVLASGNSMDQATLERLFQRIILRLEASWGKSPEQQRSYVLLLTRLRAFGPQQFDILMTTWMTRFLQMPSRPGMIKVLGPLISFGTLTLHDVIINLVAIDKEAAPKNPAMATIFQEALALLIAPSSLPDEMTVEETYRLRIKQVHMHKDHPLDVFHVVRRSLEEPRLEGSDRQREAFDNSRLIQHRGMHDLLQMLVLVDTHTTTRSLVIPLLKSPDRSVSDKITAVVDRLLLEDSSSGPVTIETIFNLANDLTLPFCQVKLASMFNSDDSTMSGTNDDASERLQAFDNAIESAVTAGKTTWASIVPLLDVSISEHLRQRSEAQFLAMFPSPKIANPEDGSAKQNRITHTNNLLHVIETTAQSVSPTSPTAPSQTSLALDIVSTLNDTWNLLSSQQAHEIKEEIISQWLPLLLSFITINTCAFEATKPGNESRAKAILALTAIFLELQTLETKTEAIGGLVEQIYDLALFLVDALPDDMRQQCIRSLRDTPSSRQICYLFSFAENPTKSLILVQREKPSGGPGGSVAGGEGRLPEKEKLTPFTLRRWEMLGEPTPNVGENDTSLSLTLFGARRG